MPPEPLPFDRKDFFKERKPSSSDPAGVVPARWREPPTTPSSHPNNHGPFSYRLGGAGGSSDFRRPISGHGKQVGGGWHATAVESGPREDKLCRNDSSRENNHSSSGALASISQKDRKGGNSRETTVSPHGNFHPHPDFINSWDQLQSKDLHDKNNGGGVCTTGGQRLENESSLGSSIDWKPLKWIRSGSLSSRGSGFSHSSSSKSIGMDSLDMKIDVPPGNSTPLQSPSGDAGPCLTPRTPADEVSSRKKPRLGWGEGLAKYEKKKVGPDDIVDKDAETKNGTVDGVSSLEPLLPSPNLPDKSPSLNGCSECASPATPYSFACSSSPGLEEKASTKTAAIDNDICNPCVPSCHVSHEHTEGSTFNLENLELTEVVNLSSSLNELLQSDDTSGPTSGFVRSTAMDKLQVWKADISRTLEITESEIDSLENELKLLVSDVGGSCSLPAASCSLPTKCNVKNTDRISGSLPLRIIASGDTLTEKADGSVELAGVEDLDRESPGTATSKFVEPFTLCDITPSDVVEQRDSSCILHIRSENMEAKCSGDNVCNDILGVVTACGDGSQLPADGCMSLVPVSGDVHYSRTDNLYELVFDSNKVLASVASDEFRKLLPSNQWCNYTPRVTNDSQIKEKFAMRKRFLKFKERAITLKFRAFQYLWKEDLRLLSVPRFGAKSQKKFELSSRMGYPDYQKHRSSIRSRFSYPDGNLSLVPTREIIDYASKLLSDSHVRVHRNTLKMPSLILDKRERATSRFISDNGLVENPCDVELERSVINPWTSEEKEIFLDKFSLFGKDFRSIASFLEHKTVADCVEFYYKNHKSDRFQKTKKHPEFAKQGKSHSTNTYLVTSGKRWNREMNAASLDMLGAASAMAANVDGGKERRQKCPSKFYIGTSRDHKLQRVDGGILERSDNLVMSCNERETAAADVLAGICGSISSEALSSCITSLADPGDVYHQDRICQKLGGSSTRQPATPDGSQNDVDEETCSDDSCGGEMGPSDWTDEEKSSFLHALRSYGKDFSMISRCMRTRSRDQCKVFFSKARKCLGLDAIYLERGKEGTMGGNRGGGSDHDDTCMVDSGSVISCDKSSSEFKVDVEDLHSSDSKQELAESDRIVASRESEFGSENLVSHGCEAENKPEIDLVGGKNSNGNFEEAADSEATGAANIEEASRNTYSEGSVRETNDQASASGAKAEVDTVDKVSSKICREEIQESEHQLASWNSNTSEVRALNACSAEDLNSASHYSRGSSLDLSIDPGNSLELNGVENPCEGNNGFLASNLVCRDPIVSPHRKTLSQDDTSSGSLSFRKSLSQRSSSTDGYHLHLPKHSLMDCVESSHILRGYPVTVSTNKGVSGSLGQNEFKLDKSLPLEQCLPRDCSLQMCTSSLSHEQRQGEVGKPGDVKLFGQILTNPLSNGKFEKPNGRKSFNLKFDNRSSDRNLASLDLDNHGFGVKKNVPLRSYGFWDGNRIQTGFSSLPPDSSVLLAKYPAAFGNTTKLEESHSFVNEQLKGFHQSREVNRCSNYHNAYMSQEGIQPFTVDKLLLSEIPRRKDSEGGRVMVSDPVAAIRMHYAKTTEQYKNGNSNSR
ncbi:uncharacterized protein LOC112510223 isoform X2 [Cynara cardunculus var. scolymus]|uniref:Homeodomain-like protein n=1 Tax=Cynara cardunculus var. scolymus TaxID=59895 RepID=A0A103YII3_CYNCS|nr:uncharacterized protein LOC112510223 isoform X2 [Cynara cardunculus var. scolymus]KVI09746.1 Homeodomain-like protein [Cynara cardunculus var. scolymus]